MKWLEVRLKQVEEVVLNYDCSNGLSDFLKEYFRKKPNMGGRDRKQVSAAVFDYFRVGRVIPALSFKEKIAASIFLCEDNPDQFYTAVTETLGEGFSGKISLPVDEKLKIISELFPAFTVDELFPSLPLSEGIDREEFCKSFLLQPAFFIRIKREFYDQVKSDFRSINVQYEEEEDQPFALKVIGKSDVHSMRGWQNGLFEIQDLSSQKIASMFKPEEGEHWWDCCAGSGGKSLALADKNNLIKITATDIRPSILKNYSARLDKSGFYNCLVKQADLSKPGAMGKGEIFDNIIADVPCTGSGTWARTPESVKCFNEEEAEKFSLLQTTIATNALIHLKPGGKFYYITCSVFRKENEEVVEKLLQDDSLKMQFQMMVQGYNQRADSLFMAVLERLN